MFSPATNQAVDYSHIWQSLPQYLSPGMHPIGREWPVERDILTSGHLPAFADKGKESSDSLRVAFSKMYQNWPRLVFAWRGRVMGPIWHYGK